MKKVRRNVGGDITTQVQCAVDVMDLYNTGNAIKSGIHNYVMFTRLLKPTFYKISHQYGSYNSVVLFVLKTLEA